MPVITTRVEYGIYLNEWIDVVNIEEVLDATDVLEALAAEDDCDQFVALISAEKVTNFPTSLRDLNRSIPTGVIEIIIYGLPLIGGIVLRSFKPFSPVPIAVFKTKAEALPYAQAQAQKIQ